MTQTDNYLIAATKSWNRNVFNEKISGCPGEWHLIDKQGDLTVEQLTTINPRMVFFLHWSWKVPDEIIEQYECVCFHMSDLPYGRGGSPLQNLIVRGHSTTKLSALRMVGEFDAGPVYLKSDLSLAGSAAEIFIRASSLAGKMIRTIIQDKIVPEPQSGKIVTFTRRKPEQSCIPADADLENVYDYIRMLDAEGYPKAFIQLNGLRYSFSNARVIDGQLLADVIITPNEKVEK